MDDNEYITVYADGFDTIPGIDDNSGDYTADVEDYGDAMDTSALDDVPNDEKLARVRVLAKLQVQRERAVSVAEETLKAAKVKLAEVAEGSLPTLLVDLGLKEIPLTNGAKIVLNKKLVAYVKVENKEPFFAWMEKKGFGPLIKRKVTVEYPMGSARKAGLLLRYVNRHMKEFICSDDKTIHPGTLNAWAKELTDKNLEAAADGAGKIIEFPEEVKLTELKESVIKMPKGKKEVDWN